VIFVQNTNKVENEIQLLEGERNKLAYEIIRLQKELDTIDPDDVQSEFKQDNLYMEIESIKIEIVQLGYEIDLLRKEL